MKTHKLEDFLYIMSPVLISIGGMCIGVSMMHLWDKPINPAAWYILFMGLILVVSDITLWIIAGKIRKKTKGDDTHHE